jgi:hypothetical protein
VSEMEAEAIVRAEDDCELFTEQALARGTSSVVYTRLFMPPTDALLLTQDLADWSGVLSTGDDDLEEFCRRNASTFLMPGGEWVGSEGPTLRAMAIARRVGLQVTGAKRSVGNDLSDHHMVQTAAFAADFSNFPTPTPEMDLAARLIGLSLGESYEGGEPLIVSTDEVRAVLLWRVPGHVNNIHFGCRVR